MQLHRGDVLNGAMELLDSEGLDALTMRKLAAHLGVQAGALYWHFANKQALLDAMAEKLVEGVGAPQPDGPWDQRLTILAERLHRALLSHRDGARVFAGTYVAEPNTLLFGKATIDILQPAGLPPERAAWISFSLAHYVLGHTIEEQAQAELAAQGAWQAKMTAIQEREGPDFARTITAVFDAEPDERFRYGLRLFLDGIRHQLPTPAATPRTARQSKAARSPNPTTETATGQPAGRRR